MIMLLELYLAPNLQEDVHDNDHALLVGQKKSR